MKEQISFMSRMNNLFVNILEAKGKMILAYKILIADKEASKFKERYFASEYSDNLF